MSSSQKTIQVLVEAKTNLISLRPTFTHYNLTLRRKEFFFPSHLVNAFWVFNTKQEKNNIKERPSECRSSSLLIRPSVGKTKSCCPYRCVSLERNGTVLSLLTLPTRVTLSLWLQKRANVSESVRKR